VRQCVRSTGVCHSCCLGSTSLPVNLLLLAYFLPVSYCFHWRCERQSRRSVGQLQSKHLERENNTTHTYTQKKKNINTHTHKTRIQKRFSDSKEKTQTNMEKQNKDSRTHEKQRKNTENTVTLFLAAKERSQRSFMRKDENKYVKLTTNFTSRLPYWKKKGG
jgi:hypothetical protein